MCKHVVVTFVFISLFAGESDLFDDGYVLLRNV